MIQEALWSGDLVEKSPDPGSCRAIGRGAFCAGQKDSGRNPSPVAKVMEGGREFWVGFRIQEDLRELFPVGRIN